MSMQAKRSLSSFAGLMLVAAALPAAALAAKAPHPHAAMLLIDFLLSKQGQLMYRDIGYLSARADMPVSDIYVKDKLFLGNRPTFLEDYAHWSRLFQDVFVTHEAP